MEKFLYVLEKVSKILCDIIVAVTLAYLTFNIKDILEFIITSFTK